MQKPEGNHTCSHQTRELLRCPVPSCPGGVRGDVYRLKFGRGGREAQGHANLRRVRTDAEPGWKWEPITKAHENRPTIRYERATE